MITIEGRAFGRDKEDDNAQLRTSRIPWELEFPDLETFFEYVENYHLRYYKYVIWRIKNGNQKN